MSRIENARIAVSARDLAALLHYYGTPEDVRAELLAMVANDEGRTGCGRLGRRVEKAVRLSRL
ncbi:helix-turn-helix domain-containing protein [Micromonospora sp. CPCC 205547]|uniref:helix-turn-helix domain-containing protein n=1 Tax=Micromonospora sp. CPCC 205547 TaxID=3122400 RepID=UPI003B967D1A